MLQDHVCTGHGIIMAQAAGSLNQPAGPILACLTVQHDPTPHHNILSFFEHFTNPPLHAPLLCFTKLEVT